MSTSLKQAIEAAKVRVGAAFDAVVAKGGTKPSVANLAALPSAIQGIPAKEPVTSPTSISFSKNMVAKKLIFRDHFNAKYITTLRQVFQYNHIEVIDLRDAGFGRITDLYAAFSDSSAYDACSQIYMRGIDTSIVTNIRYLVNTCTQLVTLDIANCDFHSVTSDTNYAFNRCDKLETIIGDATIEEVRSGEIKALVGLKISITLVNSTNLNFASMLAACKGVGTATSSETLTFSRTAYNKLTDDEKAELDTAIAGKNWVIATA